MYYLVGIKGTGMSALANALYKMGYSIIGSDKSEIYFTDKELNKNNIEILCFDKQNIIDNKSCIFIIGYSYNEYNNEEVKMIKEMKLPYFYYGDFLNRFFDGIKIGVSGSHGKTTICKMLSTYLNDSSYIIGDGSGNGIKNSKYFIFEACEYKKHFLDYNFDYLIINNIDYDHPDYYKNESEYTKAFMEAAKKADKIIVNGDDKNIKSIKHKKKYTYGFKKCNYCKIRILSENEIGYKVSFSINREIFIIFLPFYGKHMIYNFASCFLLMHLQKINLSDIKINDFKMPNLRMSEKHYKSNIIIDDYAHHPTEIKSLLKAVKQKYPSHEILTIFQPHTYSRTLLLKKDFKDVFKDVKESYLVRTFLSREDYDKNKEKEVKKVFKKSKYLTNDDLKKMENYQNKIILFIGAGNFHSTNQVIQ